MFTVIIGFAYERVNLPLITKNVEDVLKVIQFFDSVKLCIGNPDPGLVNMWKKKVCHCIVLLVC